MKAQATNRVSPVHGAVTRNLQKKQQVLYHLEIISQLPNDPGVLFWECNLRLKRKSEGCFELEKRQLNWTASVDMRIQIFVLLKHVIMRWKIHTHASRSAYVQVVGSRLSSSPLNTETELSPPIRQTSFKPFAPAMVWSIFQDTTWDDVPCRSNQSCGIPSCRPSAGALVWCQSVCTVLLIPA